MKPNVVIFSSGESDRNGNLGTIVHGLSRYANCRVWRDLFHNSLHSDQVFLLRMLMKKIPTFDFAILLCEGHDRTTIMRDGVKSELWTMRDNVLFEIGLCAMGLGLTRVILLTDGKVRIPDDLIGGSGETAVKQIPYRESVAETIPQIIAYIEANINDYFPIVVGAATSTAIGYMQNFVFRTLENWNGTVYGDDGAVIQVPLEAVRFSIYIPECYDPEAILFAQAHLRSLRRGFIETAGERRCDFRYYRSGDRLIIVDLPTTLKTSCDTASIYLSIQADDNEDMLARQRFADKEFSLFSKSIAHIMENTELLKFLLRTDDPGMVEYVKNAVYVKRSLF